MDNIKEARSVVRWASHLSSLSPSMEHSDDLPLHWTPPTPYVVSTTAYFGGRPTPPFSPFRPRDTPAFDDYAPCPPTPRFVPYDEDEQEFATRGISPASPARPLDGFLVEPIALGHDTMTFQIVISEPKPVHPTSFTHFLTNTTTHESTSNNHRHNTMNSRIRISEPTLPPRPSNDWRIPKPVRPTGSTHFLTNITTHESNDHRHARVSDYLIYAFDVYARPCPVLMVIQRSILDRHGHPEWPIDLSTCTEPFRLFSFSGGYPPKTGLDWCDRQTFEYYIKEPAIWLDPEHEFSLSFSYPISTIEAVQRSLLTQWSLVYPKPIPVLIIRKSHLVGYYYLKARQDGHSHIMLSWDSIWPAVRRRGVDSRFRPLDRFRMVETDICRRGVAAYKPQHIVASKFAVNIFLETDSDRGQGPPRCEYLGAYILQTSQAPPPGPVWEGVGVSPEDQQAMRRRIYNYFCGELPFLPMVRFLYYKWDRQILGLAKEIAQSGL